VFSLPNTARIVVPIDCQDPRAWETAFALAGSIGAKSPTSGTEYILLTHAKSQLGQTSLGNHIGLDCARALLANKKIGVNGGGVLRHATLKTLSGAPRKAVIIAYFADDKMMEIIDSLAGLIGVVAVPEFDGDIDSWIARWTPDIYGRKPAVPVELITDPVVEAALQSLSRQVNRSNTVMVSRDKESANEVLRILRAKGHMLDANNIKSWAIKNGWKNKAADELGQLSNKIQALKSKPSLSKFHDPEGKYDRWSK
jgi:hypothetical protein